MTNPDYWQDSLNYLTKTDKVLGNIISQFKDYSISSRGEAYETLLRSIVGQQISIQAASSVWNKIVVQVKTIEPHKVLLTSRENLKLCGLSKQKIQYIYNISEHFITNNIENNAYWEGRSYLSIYEELITIKGIGPWTAACPTRAPRRAPSCRTISRCSMSRKRRASAASSRSSPS